MKLLFGKPEQPHVVVDLLSAYLDNQVTPAERVRVEQHLNVCASCRSELESLRRTVALLQALPRVSLPRAFTLSEVQVGIRRPTTQPAWYGGWLRGLGAVAAIALIAFVATALLRRPGWTPSSATVARVAPTSAVVMQEAQPAAPAASAPAAAPEPVQAGEQVVETAAAEKTVALAPDATAPAVENPTVVPVPTPQSNVEPGGAAAKQSQPTPARIQGQPTTTPVQDGLAVAPTPALVAAAAPAPVAPEAGAMAFGRGGGGVDGAVDAPPGVLTPESTPPLARAESVLPAMAGLAYTDGHSVWALDAAGGPRELLQHEGANSPQISSDRTWIAFRVLSGDTSDLWAVRWDGRDTHLLLAERELPTDGLGGQYTERRIQETRWVPGYNVLAVTTVAIPASAASLPKFELWHLEVGTGRLTRVADLGRFGRPVYAPDGSQAAILQYGTEADPQGTLALFKSDGTEGRIALRFPAGPAKLSYESQVAWLPDSSGLWIAIPDPSTAPGQAAEPGQGGQYNGTTLYRVPAAGGDAQVAGHVDAFTVYWSPDGARLAYDRLAGDSPEVRELYLANANGANPQLYVAFSSGQFVNWSPDGSHFIYQDNYEAYLGAPGQAPRRLGKTISVFAPRWLSPGQFLAFHDTGVNWLAVLRGLDGNAVGLLPLSREASYDVTGP